MPDKLAEAVKGLSDGTINTIITWFVFMSTGLLALLGLLGKRTLKRIDNVVDSHMPGTMIDKKIQQVYVDMKVCQKEIGANQEKQSEKQEKQNERQEAQIQTIMATMGKMHERTDDLYHLLLSKESGSAARKERR